MDPLYARAFIEGAPPESGPIRFIAGTGGLKLDGRDYKVDGIDLARYQSNPVVLWVHDQGAPPIGRAIATEIDGDRLMIDVEFDQEDEFARQVESKYRRGFLNAVSMLAVPKDGQPARGLVAESELFEVSACPVPLDPDCLVAAGRTALVELGREISHVGQAISDRLAALGARSLSTNDKRDRLYNLLTDRFGGENTYIWVRDFGDDWVAYEVETPEDGCTTYRLGYSVDDADELTLSTDDPEEVEVRTEFVPAGGNPAPAGDTTDGGGDDESMRSLAAALEGMGFMRSTPQQDPDLKALATLAAALRPPPRRRP